LTRKPWRQHHLFSRGGKDRDVLRGKKKGGEEKEGIAGSRRKELYNLEGEKAVASIKKGKRKDVLLPGKGQLSSPIF